MRLSFRLAFCFLLISRFIFAQREGDVWCFGNNATLQFNGGIFPVANTLVALEGCASISDSAGNFLFYTNGEIVCDRFGLPMPNGSGLLGSSSSSQSAIILKQPGTGSLYYIFTVDNNYSQSGNIGNGFRYSIVDMGLNGGKGDVTVKNVLVRDWVREKLTALRHANQSDFWVLINDWTEDDVFAYKLTCTGFNLVPVKSGVGPFHGNTTNTFGCMKASLIGNRIALANWDINSISVLDFNNSTGKASNRIDITGSLLAGSAYGVEFSPSGRFLYGTTIVDPKLLQFDLNLGNGATIGNLATVLSTRSPLFDFGFGAYFGALQLGPDGKIYSANWADNVLGAIDNPDQAGFACNYVANAVSLGSNKSYLGLPNILASYVAPNPRDTVFAQICVNSVYTLPNGVQVDSPGTYVTNLTNSNGCDSVIVTQLSPVVTQIDTGTGIYICQGGSAQLNASGGEVYTWFPTIALSDPNIANPIASPTVTTTYTLVIKSATTNLLLNGDFEDGNSGFSSGYVFENPPNTIPSTYFVGSNPSQWNSNMVGCKDHTTGNSDMLMVNGAATPNENVWCQTVNVVPNTEYAFSTWVQALKLGNPAQLQFSINGNLLGSSFSASSDTCQWSRFYTEWNSGFATTANICIVNQNTISLANDFALDDIVFGPVCEAAIYKIKVNVVPQIPKLINATVCTGTGYTLPDGSVVFNGGIYIDTITGGGSCDTVYRTTLNIEPQVQKVIDTTVCAGTGYTLPNGSVVFNSGVYMDTILGTIGCDTLQKINLTVLPELVDSVVVTNIDCSTGVRGRVALYASGGEAPYVFALLGIDTNRSGLFTDLNSGGYSYKIQDNRGCSITGNLNVEEGGLLTISVTPPLSYIAAGDVVNYVVTTNTANASIIWNPTTYLSCDTCRNVTATPNENIVYTITARVDVGDFACVADTSVRIIVKQGGVWMPNAFTPNGDGNNEVIKLLYYGDVQMVSYRIFNRWGELIFETNDIADGWDGRYKGAAQPAGVYVYYVLCQIRNGNFTEAKSLIGSLTLIR